MVFGVQPLRELRGRRSVSVSSGGSTWFLGISPNPPRASHPSFQYPLADRLGFWGPGGSSAPGPPACFSILWRIDLVFGVGLRSDRGQFPQVSVSSGGSTWFLGLTSALARGRASSVSVSSGGSTWFLGFSRYSLPASKVACFSILWRIDLVFGAARSWTARIWSSCFSILWRIDLVFGVSRRRRTGTPQSVSVSSGGSTWFLGRRDPGPGAAVARGFQYPLADRLGFWGGRAVGLRGRTCCFSILWRIDLVFGEGLGRPARRRRASFSILWRIDLVFGDRRPH